MSVAVCRPRIGRQPTNPRQSLRATGPANPRTIINVSVYATFVVVLAQTLMTVAVTDIAAAFNVSDDTAQWTTTGFLLAMGVGIPVAGYLLQTVGTRRLFIAAMGTFNLGTVIAAVAPTFATILTGRIIQGLGTAVMAPLMLLTIAQLVPADVRGRAIGTITIVTATAPAIGPPLAGIATDAFGWRSLLLFMLPASGLALILATLKAANITTPTRVRLDITSVALSTIGFSLLIYGSASIRTSSRAHAIAALAAGVITLTVFARRQQRLAPQGRALLNLGILTNRLYRRAVAVLVLTMTAILGVIVLLPRYLDSVLGLDPKAVGLLLLPGGIVTAVGAPLAGVVVDRYGPRTALVPGTLAITAAIASLAAVDTTTPVGYVLAAHVLMSAGISFVFTPVFATGLNAVEPLLYTPASTVLNTAQQVAGALGSGLLATIAAMRTDSLLPSAASHVEAHVGGFQLAFAVSAALAAVTAVIATTFPKRSGRIH
jgi:DHA2 family lincomycin resistance protein-like MFS transporter